MSHPSQHLVLLVPGLCGPDSDPPVSEYLQARPAALDRLLSRSKPVQHKTPGLDAALCRWFGLDQDRQPALPVAPLTYLADAGQAPGGYILRADPVHLRADQSCLRLFDSSTFAISRQEADELVSAFNQFYAGRGMQLQAPCPRRWYLLLSAAPAITTTDISRLGGQDINRFLPQGKEMADWHRILTEVQMLFHTHPVNAAREQCDEPAINSLWFWGGGRLPDTLHSRATRVLTHHPLGTGLALQAAIPRMDVPDGARVLLPMASDGVTLVVLDGLAGATQYGDIERWMDRLRDLEKSWFGPLLESLRQGALSSLEIDPCSGTAFLTSRRQQRLFWKRDRPFESLCKP